ncbi:MAG: copper-binding protein [Lysobacter sp.]|nr:copper-binding protein [Lysobacter sp.]
MKTATLMFALVFAAACTPQEEPAVTDTQVAPLQTQEPVTSPVTDPMAAPSTAAVQTTGVVEEIDVDAGTVTIAHEAIEAFEWPPMTMTFAAPGVDLSHIRQGEQVTFELTRTGVMEGTVTSISSDQATP